MDSHREGLVGTQPAYLLLLVLVSVVNAASQVLMRWGGVRAAQRTAAVLSVWEWLWVSRWWVFGIMVGWISGLGWAWCLRRLPLGLAIPLYAGLAYVLSIGSAAYILKEKMSAGQVVGIAVILAGVLLVTLSSRPAPGA